MEDRQRQGVWRWPKGWSEGQRQGEGPKVERWMGREGLRAEKCGWERVGALGVGGRRG